MVMPLPIILHLAGAAPLVSAGVKIPVERDWRADKFLRKIAKLRYSNIPANGVGDISVACSTLPHVTANH